MAEFMMMGSAGFTLLSPDARGSLAGLFQIQIRARGCLNRREQRGRRSSGLFVISVLEGGRYGVALQMGACGIEPETAQELLPLPIADEDKRIVGFAF
jgi:hypothetical protein